MSTSIGKLIDAMYEAREAYNAALAIANTEKEKVKALEYRLLETMKAANVEYSRTRKALATVKKKTPASVQDWSAFSPWVAQDPATRLHLLEKRVAQLAFKEYMETATGLPPGIRTVEIETIGLTKATKD